MKEMEEHKSREVEEIRLEKQHVLSKLEQEKRELEQQKEELESLIHREKVELDKERQVLEREKLSEIEGIIREKEMEIEDLKEKAQHEIDELRERLDETERLEFCSLPEFLERGACLQVFCAHAVRVRRGMTLRNADMWHDLQNGIIMRDVIHAE